MAEVERRPSEPQDGSIQLGRIGEILRSARQGRFTLEGLANASHVSVGLISQMERGLGNPSLSTLHKLAAALDIPVARFFDAPAGPRRMLVRLDERLKLELPGPSHEGLSYELLTPDFQGQLALFLIRFPGHWDNKDQRFVGQGEETVHVIEGRLEVHVAGEKYVLEEGDTITYDDSLQHWFRNPLASVTRIINALVPPPL